MTISVASKHPPLLTPARPAEQRLDRLRFIKIDVEGMARGALAGLKSTIALQRPIVSLAIYHSAEDLWRLPLDLMQQLPDCHFHISHYSPVRWGTTLTAVPRELRGANHERG